MSLVSMPTGALFINLVFSKRACMPVRVESSLGSNPYRVGSFKESDIRYDFHSYFNPTVANFVALSPTLLYGAVRAT